MNPWWIALIAFASCSAAMAAMWWYARAKRNYGYVDVAWGGGVGLCAVLFAALVDGDPVRRLLVGGMALVWATRLTWHLFRRVHNAEEDGRYQTMRQSLGDKADRGFFAFFQLQATWCVLFALPMLGATAGLDQPIGWREAVGVMVWLVAVVGELIADHQLAAFRSSTNDRTQVCQVGLWRYSRHPNYFFEWLGWWAYVAIGVTGPLGAMTLLGPLVMLVFLFTATGIPPTENRAIKSRGDRYRRYQQTTSVFLPWPPRHGSHATSERTA